MKKIFFSGLFLCSLFSSAYNLDPIRAKTGLIPSIAVGVNLFNTSTVANYNSNVQFIGGIDSNYFFNESVGLRFGAMYNTRNLANSSGTTVTAPFIDIPLCLTFQPLRKDESDMRTHTYMGFFYTMPIGDYSGGTLLANQRTQGAYGFTFGGEVHFKISETLRLGPAFWYKQTLGTVSQSIDFRYTELGFGMLFGFI